MAPTWVEYSNDSGDAHIAEVDCTQNQELCQKHGVRGYPTLLLFQDGGEGVKFQGQRDIPSFKKFIAQQTGAAAPVVEEKKPETKQEEGSDVVVLGSDNFDSTIAGKDFYVKFYAPWCGHCKNMIPVWNELAAADNGINVAKVDCTVHKDLASKFEVRGFPTIILFKSNGEQVKYSGARSILLSLLQYCLQTSRVQFETMNVALPFLLLTVFAFVSAQSTFYLFDGYYIDDGTAAYGVNGQKVDLQLKTLIRDGTEIGVGQTTRFGKLVDIKERDVCAYPPQKLFTSQGEVDVAIDPSAWNPQSQSKLFLPDNEDILVPFNAYPDQVLDISTDPDFNTIMQFNGKLYMSVHHESPRPSQISFLDIELVDGSFNVLSTRKVDFSQYNGTWGSCAGSLSPWGTHLGSQEYEPDARIVEECDTLDCMTDLKDEDSQNIRYFMRHYEFYEGGVNCYADQQQLTMDAVKQYFNPYMYGYIPEVGVDADGNPTSKLWFTLGRFSHETPKVVGDNKTVYLTDDGTNVGFYKFVADQPNDLSSGCIFGAKVTQLEDNTFDMQWIQLGCNTNDELEDIARSGIMFSDMFVSAEPTDDATCPAGFVVTNVGHDNRLECLRLRPGQTDVAAFLETRRTLAVMGGTTEFSKWEGLTYDPKRNRIYIGASEIRYGMEDFMKKGETNDKYDIGGPNDVRLAYNPCGCVYAADLDDDYNAINLYPLICGTMTGSGDDIGCEENNISGPDNVVMMGQDAILISEDTDMHVNTYLWMFDLETQGLTRMASCMYGAEVTGPWYHENIQGSSFIFYVCQHPYKESNRDKVVEPDATGEAGWVNYLGPLPVLGDGDYIICDNIQPPTGADKHKTLATTACYVGTYQLA
eukprot:TRINITY_DN2669_c0_g2_i2.p1 TRINITY_DN2669_c0_g2~~TRINITY_DN2669_c0_g2_i2.p1  ORF type:complete len:950 (+),score=137.83 TRINITY_DN2669_c0_g2_i2:247-2850(+)